MSGAIGAIIDVEDADAQEMLSRKGCELLDDAPVEVAVKPKRGQRSRLKDIEVLEADALTLSEPVPELVE
jgi:hypothetical protein